MQIDDLLSNGMVRRWSLVDGQARCVEDALASADAGALPALKRNAAIRVMIGAVEAYEAAQAVVARGEPDNGQPKQIPDPAAVRPEDAPDDWAAPLIDNPAWSLLPRTVETIGPSGDLETTPEPRWVVYDDAQALVAAAGAPVVALAAWRKSEPADDGSEERLAWEAARDAAIAELDRLAALPLATDPRWPSFSADAVKAECGRRIYGVASDSAQKNMLANAVAGHMSTADKATFRSGVDWIAAMQTVCRSLVAAQDVSFAADEHWPPVPDGVADLAARF